MGRTTVPQKSTTTRQHAGGGPGVEGGVAELDRPAVEQGLAAAAAHRVVAEARAGHAVGGKAVRARDQGGVGGAGAGALVHAGTMGVRIVRSQAPLGGAQTHTSSDLEARAAGLGHRLVDARARQRRREGLRMNS
jgi:hypothetical protein